MSNLERMQELARIAQEKQFSQEQLKAILKEVARDTGHTYTTVKQVFNASLLALGVEEGLVR